MKTEICDALRSIRDTGQPGTSKMTVLAAIQKKCVHGPMATKVGNGWRLESNGSQYLLVNASKGSGKQNDHFRGKSR